MTNQDAKSLIPELFGHTIEDVCMLTWKNNPERFKNSYDCLFSASHPTYVFRFESKNDENSLLDKCLILSYGGDGNNLHYSVSPIKLKDISKTVSDIYINQYTDIEFSPVSINNLISPLYGMGNNPICAKTIGFASKNGQDIGFFVEFQNGFHFGTVIGPDCELVTLFNEHSAKAIAKAEQMHANDITITKYSYPYSNYGFKNYLNESDWFS